MAGWNDYICSDFFTRTVITCSRCMFLLALNLSRLKHFFLPRIQSDGYHDNVERRKCTFLAARTSVFVNGLSFNLAGCLSTPLFDQNLLKPHQPVDIWHLRRFHQRIREDTCKLCVFFPPQTFQMHKDRGCVIGKLYFLSSSVGLKTHWSPDISNNSIHRHKSTVQRLNILLIMHPEMFQTIELVFISTGVKCLCYNTRVCQHPRANSQADLSLPCLRPRRSVHRRLSSRKCRAEARPQPRRRSWRRCPPRRSRSSAG